MEVANKGLSVLMVLKEENSSQDPKAYTDVLSRCKSRRLAPESVTNSLRI